MSLLNGGANSSTPGLFRLIWRVGDLYRLVDWRDQTYPLSFLWLCTSDGGATYNPVGCRHNNTTTQVHEVRGDIPAAWDNLAGWDTEPQAGRVTVDGFVNQNGQPTAVCEAPGTTCYPFRAHRAFTGTYGSVLIYTTRKGTNIQPPRDGDLYFNGVPSGWVGPGN